jgi:DNA sulfur modification protein DndD
VQLLNLSVDNLGVYRGQHHFDLAPLQRPEDTTRGLTVSIGKNGSGKSTLFRAMGLALHGSMSLGERVSRRAYNDYLLDRLHRHSESGTTVVSREGGVALGFRYVRSGRTMVVEVERRWRRNQDSVSETLTILCNGEPPEVNQADYQTWLNDLIPPGLAPLCFFDAELLDALTLPEGRGGALLGDTLRRLLGLDLVGRLQADLAHFTARSDGGKEADRLSREVLEHQAAIEELDVQIGRLRSRTEFVEEECGGLEVALERQRRRLAAEGGAYAARRNDLQEQHSTVVEEIESVSEQLRELSSGLLPFAFVPGLSRTLADKLTWEAKLYRQEVAGEYWQQRVSEVESILQDEESLRELGLPPEDHDAVARHVVRLLRETGPPAESIGEETFVHRLAEPEHDRLQGWIAQALHSVPQQVHSLGERLRTLRKRRRHIEEDLRRAPEDEALLPIHKEIERLQTRLDELRSQQKGISEKLGALLFQREERDRQRQRIDERLSEARAGERRLALAERSKLVLRTYQDALTRERVASLETMLVESFNTLCHKDHLLGAVSIDPANFEVRLRDVDGQGVKVSDFSAGERQLYALALLWALRRVSKRRLPLAVDTPLARLDGAHRERFLHRYVPRVSDQVLLFATDVEMNDDTLAQVEPYLARVYRLRHDPQHNETRVVPDNRSTTGQAEPNLLDELAARGSDANL